MPRRFSLGHCCCETPVCTGCCQGSWPTEFDVEFTLSNDTCSNCGSWDGIYTLAKVSGQCSWKYDTGYTLSNTCSGANPLKRIELGLAITCYDALGVPDTVYTITFTAKLYREQDCYDVCPPFGSLTNNWIDTHTWRRSSVPISGWTCNGASNYELPWYSRSTRRDSKTSCVFSPGNFSCASPTITTNFLCQSNTASAYITAV